MRINALQEKSHVQLFSYQVAAVPGEAFGFEAALRLSYATGLDVIKSGLDRFEEFCERHLGHLDEVADAYFATEAVRDAIREKVEALYPDHEHDAFTDLFWTRIQHYRQLEGGAGPQA